MEHGAEINAKYNNPLGAAIVSRNWNMIEYLVDYGANINQAHWKSEDFIPLIYYPMYYGGNLQYLIEHGADVNQPNNIKFFLDTITIHRTPLCAAVDVEEFYFIECLVEHGADVNKSNNFYHAPLTILIGNYFRSDFSSFDNEDKRNEFYIKGANYLINHGANVNLCNNYDTVLTYAIQESDLKMIRCLVENGADVNKVPKNGNSPLQEAVYKGDMDIIKYLIDNKVDLSDAETIFSKNQEIIDYLKEKGINLYIYIYIIHILH